MKAVATALVLIAGAAVILWYGNTLNSWVLGGLIGGLAALLLSIPISLTIFSYLSHRHEARIREEIEEEMAQVEDYVDLPAVEEVYEVESYALAPDEELWDEAPHRPASPARYLPAPPPYQRLPIAQSQELLNRGYTPPRQGTYAPAPVLGPLARTKDAPGRRLTSRRLNQPSLSSNESVSERSQQQAAALRAARREAARLDDGVEEIPTHLSRRRPSGRLQPPLPPDHATQQFSLQSPKRPRQRSRRMVDSTLAQPAVPPALPMEGESTASRRKRDPQTEYLRKHYPETEQMYHPYAQTGEMVHPPQRESRPLDREASGKPRRSPETTGSLQKSHVRRAPFLYEDDPLRQKLAQQIQPPIVRRSSRLEFERDDSHDQ